MDLINILHSLDVKAKFMRMAFNNSTTLFDYGKKNIFTIYAVDEVHYLTGIQLLLH